MTVLIENQVEEIIDLQDLEKLPFIILEGQIKEKTVSDAADEFLRIKELEAAASKN